MPQIRITLPANLTAEHLRAVLKYFERTNRLSPNEWKLVFAAFDALGKAELVIGRRRLSFRQFYDRELDRRWADSFITRLTTDSEAEVEALQQRIGFEIIEKLEQDGIYHEEVAGSEYLAAYCLYWWTSFARGYRFEMAIFRDLRAAGVDFQAHDLRVRAQRRSPYDLAVLGRLGDIKNTTYFLHSARSLPLKSDFYITRLYHSRRRRYVLIVILTEETWHDLDGAVAKASLETAAELFPEPAQIVFEGQSLIVVTFDLWKDKVKRRQQEEN